jgi:hypothetical protein
MDRQPTRGLFVERADFQPSGLPTVMRKVFDLVHEGKKR